MNRAGAARQRLGWLAACAVLGGAAFAATAAGAAAAVAAGPAAPLALAADIDALVQSGQDQPAQALEGLAQLARRGASARALATARGLVAATTAQPQLLAASVSALAALADDKLAAADAALLRATAAELQGDGAASLAAAQDARQGYDAACATRSDCDHRQRWRTLQLLVRQDMRRGLFSNALEKSLAAADLARDNGDAPRQVQALAMAADAAGLSGDSAAEQSHFSRAQRLARLEGSPLLRSRVCIFETRLLRRRGDDEGARRAAAQGLALARQGGSPRLAATHLANLADVLVATGQPRAALAAVDAALPVVRRYGDRRIERALVHNAALARVALGQTATALPVLDELLAAHRSSGATAEEAGTLREFAEAFAAAGDLPTALSLFHRERDLAARIMAANRDAALADLRQRFDRDAQQGRLARLGRENTLMGAQLENRAALQKVWAAGALALLLAAAAVALMYRRVHVLNRRLAINHAELRAQSHRDPLTGLHNRRGLHEHAVAQGAGDAFTGALLLVDIDHFKRVNDGHGHAAGDTVLVEVARRLAAAVREDDLVVRWGGEEFLVCMASADAAQALALAQRVLQAIGGAPVVLPAAAQGDGGGSGSGSGSGGTSTSTSTNTSTNTNAVADRLRVTASVGHAAFPLPPAQLPLTLERAINLVDMALYTAKNQGRNCAVGIRHAAAADADALRALEADFDQARLEGRVTLERTAGPEGDAPPAVRQARADDARVPA